MEKSKGTVNFKNLKERLTVKLKGTESKQQKKESNVKDIKSPTFSQQRKNSPLAAINKKLLAKTVREKDLGEVSNEEKPKKSWLKPISWLKPRNKNNVSMKTSTPSLRDKKTVPSPNTDTKLLKKGYWKRRPKPAHSGVPLPVKMKEYLLGNKDKIVADFSFHDDDDD